MPIARPTVSVVVVNYRGAEDTITCVRSFEGDGIDWPGDALELIVVDNASGDRSAERIREAAVGADVRVVESERNLGFAGGCNLGVAHASGEYTAFLNNDARPHPQWISAAVGAFERQAAVGAVASKVLDWEGKTIDFADASLTWFGMGYKREVEEPDDGRWDRPADVLFGTGSAMFVRTQLFRDVGGFDDRYFMFYEDVDLGWRLNLLGHRVRYVPESIAYHRHHASMKSYGPWHEHYLLERNALFTLYKNYGDDSLAKALPPAMALAVRRGISRGADDPHSLDLGRPGEHGDAGQARLSVAKETLTGGYAVDAFVEQLPGLRADREQIQKARRRSDAELRPLFRQVLEPAYADPRFLEGHQVLVDAFGIAEHFGDRRRVVVVTGEPLTERMAGPAIRAWAIAEALSAEHEVELVTFGECTVSHPRFRARALPPAEVKAQEEWCDVFVFQGLIMTNCPWLKDSRKVLVADVYNPFHLEQLEQAKDRSPEERALAVHDCATALNEQLRRGDLLLCASDKQRDFWLGQMAAVGRVNPETYDDDETLASLIKVVPFGIPATPPQHTRPVLRGVVPGIDEGDDVVLWGGGIYNWFDPLTLIRAIDRLRSRRPRVRLFFLGLRHPNPAVPQMRMAVAAQSLSDELDLTGTHVFFNEGWVPYDDRQNYLLEADIGVSTHMDHVETAYSFRTRILDYIWAGLPLVATEGDSFAPLIERERLGATVPAEDVEALEGALVNLLDDPERAAACRANVVRVASSFTWEEVLAPLVEFCRHPRRAPDLVTPFGEPLASGRPRPKLRDDLDLAREYFRDGGASEVARRAMGRAKKLVSTR
jgi:GT2 family glycosyltransferase